MTPIKLSTRKPPGKPTKPRSRLGSAAYRISMAACMLFTAVILSVLVATLIDPDMIKTGSTASRLLMIALSFVFGGAVLGLLLGIASLFQPRSGKIHPAWAVALALLIFLGAALFFIVD